MECQQLLNLLNTESLSKESRDAVNGVLAAHICSCSSCRLGIARLSEALASEDVLTCEQCLALLPAYYEATRPDCPIVTISEADIIEVALHLAHCENCAAEYEALVELWRLEQDDLLDS